MIEWLNKKNLLSLVLIFNSKEFLKDYGETKFITGMRAFAAFAVVLIHTGGAGLRDLGQIGNNLADLGRTGVYAFFVISGFSVAVSYDTSQGYLSYLMKRILRIAPLYYFWLIISMSFMMIASVYGSKTQIPDISLWNLLAHFFFIGFLDYSIANSIIGVEWSIFVEIFWYFVIPVFFVAGKNNKSLVILVILSFCFYMATQKYQYLLPVNLENSYLAMHWSPLPYFFPFALGFVAYKIRPKAIKYNNFGNLIVGLSLSCLIFYVFMPKIINLIFLTELILISIITANIIIWSNQKNIFIRVIFCNPLVQFLGVVSYGIYLSHLPIMNIVLFIFDNPNFNNSFFMFVVVSGFSIIISALTYHFIERKFNLMGAKLSAHF